MNRKPLKPMNKLMDEYFSGGTILERKGFSAVLGLKKSWKEIIGEAGAKISFPFRLYKQVLYVALYNNIWMAEMPYIKPMLLEKINGCGITVTDIKFVLAKIKPPEEQKSGDLTDPTDAQKEYARSVSCVMTKSAPRDAFYKALLTYLSKNNL